MSQMKLKLPTRLLCSLVIGISVSSCASLEKQNELIIQNEHQTAQMEQYNHLLESQQQQVEQLTTSISYLSEGIARLDLSIEDVDKRLKKINSAAHSSKTAAPPIKVKPVAPKPIMQAIKPEKTVLGRVEWAKIEYLNEYLKARIDTGAKSSSLHATNVQFFERDGEKWVKFDINSHRKAKDDEEKATTLESPLVRKVKIKKASSPEMDERAVIKLMAEVGDLKYETEFTLTNRTEMNYPILLGRNFLRDVAVVDVAKVFTIKRKTNTTNTQSK